MHLKYTLKLIAENLSRTVFSIILAVFGIVVTVFTAIVGVGTEYARNSADRLLTGGFEKTGIVRAYEFDMTFIEDLKAQPEIAAIGSISRNESRDLPELAAIQHAHNGESGRELEMIMVYSDTLNLCKIEFQEGQLRTEYPDDHLVYLYLGANFAEIPVGTVYETERTTYTVAGILQRSQRFIDNRLSNDFEQNISDYTFNCDNSVIEAFPYLFSSDFWLGASENYTFEQAIDKAFDIAEKHGIEISCRTLQKSYEDAMIDVLTVKGIFSRLMPIVCIACVVMILCMQISDIRSGLRGFGIMYSQGFSGADIEKITVAKNLITFLISVLLSLPLINWLLKFWYNAKDGKEVMMSLLFKTALPAALAMILVIIALSTAASVIVFQRYTPVQMIGGQYD